MSEQPSSLSEILATFPVIVMMTLMNVLLGTTIAGVVFLQLVVAAGWGKGISMFIAIIVAIVIHIYIFFQPQLRHYINRRTSQ